MSHPISSRLDLLHDQWVEFAQLPDARVLRWLLAEDELRLVETFVEAECDDRAGELPDLFISCRAPFTDVDSYGSAVVEEIVARYDEGRAGMVEEGLDASWAPQAWTGRTHSLARLLEVCASLRKYHPEVALLALLLLPSEVSDYAEWQRWLRGAALHCPGGVRIVVVDDLLAPALDALAAAEPQRVHSVAAGLQMNRFLAEMARAAGSAGPDGEFRVQFTSMTSAIGVGRLEEARVAGDGALAVTERQGWMHLGAAVHFALASGFMNAGRPEEALASYRNADGCARQLTATDEELGPKLRLYAAFGVGSTLVGIGDFQRAASVYEVSAPAAARAGDAWLLTECWRMAAYCHERIGGAATAWEHYFRALTAAEGIPAAERKNSTIPFIREALLRLAAGSAPHVEAVEREVSRLLGDGAGSGSRELAGVGS
jgi:tetratricopeptide (TPR) repeat protein